MIVVIVIVLLYEVCSLGFRVAKVSTQLFRVALELDRLAMEFGTPDELKQYLKDHPGADKSKHTVKQKGDRGKHHENVKDMMLDFGDAEDALSALYKVLPEGEKGEISEHMGAVREGMERIEDAGANTHGAHLKELASSIQKLLNHPLVRDHGSDEIKDQLSVVLDSATGHGEAYAKMFGTDR